MMLAPTRWYCPNCKLEDVSRAVGIRYHTCPKLHGLSAPMLPFGTKAKVEANQRQDYLGTEIAGRYMSVVTTRDDGSDAIVFAPAAAIGRGDV